MLIYVFFLDLSLPHHAGAEDAIAPFPLEDLLPSNTNQFFRYQGSLTTPTCNEVVVWTVFTTPIPISSRQVSYGVHYLL